jgi:hypothetical protein
VGQPTVGSNPTPSANVISHGIGNVLNPRLGFGTFVVLAAPPDSCSRPNYAVYHDRYQRTPDGWKFTERVYEIRYLDTSPLAGSARRAGGQSA